MGTWTEQTIQKWRLQMNKKHMKKLFNILSHKRNLIQATMILHLMPISMEIIKKSIIKKINIKTSQWGSEGENSHLLLVRTWMREDTMKFTRVILQKFKTELLYDPDIRPLGTYKKSVYDSTPHNSQIMGSALMPIGG
jgi:hypothetical protein